jgi:hypothetical protein
MVKSVFPAVPLSPDVIEIKLGAPEVFTLPPVRAGLLEIVQFAGAYVPVKSDWVPLIVVPLRLVDEPRQIVAGVAVTGDGAAGGAETVISLLEFITQP